MTASLDEFLAEVNQSQLGWPESLRFTYDTVRQLIKDRVDGCLVECGVGAGCHPAVMARACLDMAERRPVFLFDSFDGVPHGGSEDGDWNTVHGDGSGRLEGSDVAAVPVDAVAANLVRWVDDGSEMFHFVPGWFQETVPAMAREFGPIAFLRLDGDLYASTKVCLEHLYPLVASGGTVVVDDLNLDGCRQAVLEYLQSLGMSLTVALAFEQQQIHPITESGDVFWVKP